MRATLFSALLIDKIMNLSKGMISIKTSIAYLKTIKIFRSLMLYLMAMLFCMVFSISGITMLCLTILFSTAEPPSMRVGMMMTFALMCIIIFGGLFLYLLLSEKRWMQLFQADHLTDQVSQQK